MLKNIFNFIGVSPASKNDIEITPNESISLTKEMDSNSLDWDSSNYLNSGGFSDIFSIPFKSNEKAAMMKVTNLCSSNQNLIKIIQKDIDFIQDLYSETLKPKNFLDYYGYFSEKNKGNRAIIYMCFKFLPNNLHKLIIKSKYPLKPINHLILINLFDNLINGLCFLQVNGFCHWELKPKNIMLDESNNIYFMDFGKSITIQIYLSYMALLKSNIAKTSLDNYFSPEILTRFCMVCDDQLEDDQDLEKDIRNTYIDPYKSDSFSFGLIFMELLLLKKPNNYLKQKQIDPWFEELNKYIEEGGYEENIKRKLEKIRDILVNSLQVDTIKRWDFIQIFAQNMNFEDKQKFRLHIRIESAQTIFEIRELLEISNKC